MSFQVQPAPRMMKAPMKNSATLSGSWRRSCATPAASAADHQHGINSSHEPIGRSSRDKRRYGRDHSGARVSTQLLVASATRAAAPVMASLSSNGDYRVSTLPLSVSKVLPPRLVLLASGNEADDPSTSLRLGPAGPRGCCACCCAMPHTCLSSFSVFL